MVNGYRSEIFISTSGGPQSSHLGPLLFLIYVNDISDYFHYSKFLLFADDLKIFRRIESLEDCILIQGDVDRLQEYCRINSFFFNFQNVSLSVLSLILETSIDLNFLILPAMVCFVESPLLQIWG